MFAALLACTDPDATPAPVDTGVTTPGAARWPAPEATLDPAEVPGRIESALALGVTEPWGLANTWFDLFEHADRTCPGGDEWNLPVNYGGCDTEEGWHFAGTGTFSKSEGRQTGFETTQDCEIVAPDGTRFYGTGSWGVSAPTESGNYSIKASGGYQWPAGEGLLVDGYDVFLSQWGELDADGGTVNLEGVLTQQGESLYFEGISADDTCPGGAGTIGLRDPSGGWFTLTFGCDGCGDLSYDGAPVGTGCVALADTWAASIEAVRPTDLPWRR